MLPSKLLLSLQSAEELRAVADQAFLWLDLKDPTAGSLGCPSARTAEAFLNEFESSVDRKRCRISIALGELPEKSWMSILPIAARFDFAKVALAGCGQATDWLEQVDQLSLAFRERSQLILVHYADSLRAGAPDWRTSLDAAVSIGSQYILIDTFDKSSGRLWDCYSPETIRELAKEANARGVQLSIAGSIRLEELAAARSLGASVIGVRGAACQDGSRTLGLSRDRLKQLSEIFAKQAVTV